MPKSSPWVLFKLGDWFGGSLIDDTSFLFRARASCIEHAEIVSFSENLLKDLAETYNEIYKLLYMVNRTRANEITQMLFACTGLTLSQRVAFFLLAISKKFPHVAGAKLRISISQTTLAHALGLSRPKLNQQLHFLEQKNNRGRTHEHPHPGCAAT
jgi:CRP-like cAMP-binding protein